MNKEQGSMNEKEEESKSMIGDDTLFISNPESVKTILLHKKSLTIKKNVSSFKIVQTPKSIRNIYSY
jgi:hypothetical protein